MNQLKTMKQVCELTGLTYDTLKYYCKEGLVPNHKRDHNNHRKFDDKDINWIQGLICLKECGMTIKDIKKYMQLCIEGIDTIPQRQKMLVETEKNLKTNLKRIQESMKYIESKQNYYQAIKDGKIEYSSNFE